MTVEALYRIMDTAYPVSLRCEWDNDGLMLSASPQKEVSRILLSLDVTEDAAEYAVKNGYDLIVSHHPLIFHPLRSLSPDEITFRRCQTLWNAGVSVFSFHTRFDAVSGGVNDVLAEKIGLSDVSAFGTEQELMGRIGTLSAPMPLDKFASFVKECLHCDAVFASSSGRTVSRVAVLGGDGKDFIEAAVSAGADTYLSGTLGYNRMADAKSYGINLVEAGHYFTEAPAMEAMRRMLLKKLPDAVIDFYASNPVKTY